MNAILTRLTGLLSWAPLLACVWCAQAARADAIEDFYKGKNITFVVGYGAGGGYDQYARGLSRHLGAHIPGAPNIIIQNMPGAGSLRAASYLYTIAPKDGTVIGIIDQSMPLQQLLFPDKVKIDVAKLNWIGRMVTNAAVLYAWHTAPVKTIKDAYEHELLVSTNGLNSQMITSLLTNKLGLKLKAINGYTGTNEAKLAMTRGEVQALSEPWSELRTESPDLLRDKSINLLVQMGVESHPDLKAVPLVVDLARTPDERKLIEMMTGGSEIGRSVTSPPGEPADRVAALRAAFTATLDDPAFKADFARTGLDLVPLAGDSLQKLVETQEAVSPKLVEEARGFAALKE